MCVNRDFSEVCVLRVKISVNIDVHNIFFLSGLPTTKREFTSLFNKILTSILRLIILFYFETHYRIIWHSDFTISLSMITYWLQCHRSAHHYLISSLEFSPYVVDHRTLCIPRDLESQFASTSRSPAGYGETSRSIAACLRHEIPARIIDVPQIYGVSRREVVSQIVSHWFSGRLAGTVRAAAALPTRDVSAAKALWFPGAYLCAARRFRPFRLTFRAVDSVRLRRLARDGEVALSSLSSMLRRLSLSRSADFYREQISRTLDRPYRRRESYLRRDASRTSTWIQQMSLYSYMTEIRGCFYCEFKPNSAKKLKRGKCALAE